MKNRLFPRCSVQEAWLHLEAIKRTHARLLTSDVEIEVVTHPMRQFDIGNDEDDDEVMDQSTG